ncbi:Noggin [Camelus dromedarius]|uniref:Noggin n=1 Tax=Camelus dromedarius TaxID=9838 RepID=A0A5N4D5B4_CAMDR|nr:Noggin [Camelus dromedarius]
MRLTQPGERPGDGGARRRAGSACSPPGKRTKQQPGARRRHGALRQTWGHPLALVVVLGLRAATGRGHYLHIRPAPSATLPLVDLIEHPDPIFDPKEKVSERGPCCARCSGATTIRVHGTLAPRTAWVGGGSRGRRGHCRAGPLLAATAVGGHAEEIKGLEFSEGLAPGKKAALSKKLRREVTDVCCCRRPSARVYAWNDLGSRFWPRYVRGQLLQSVVLRARGHGVQAVQVRAPHGDCGGAVSGRGASAAAGSPIQYPIIPSASAHARTQGPLPHPDT